MKSSFAKLNLRPGERRLLAGIAVVLFIVLNVVFIWPHFGDLGKVRHQWKEAENTLATYETEIKKIPEYETKLRELEGAGSTVLSADQALQLIRTVQAQATQSGVTVLGTEPRSSSRAKPSDLFDEQSVRISINTGDKELVDFLYKLGSGGSMIRVRDLSLKPDPSGSRLSGDISLVASYQKEKPGAKPVKLTTK